MLTVLRALHLRVLLGHDDVGAARRHDVGENAGKGGGEFLWRHKDQSYPAAIPRPATPLAVRDRAVAVSSAARSALRGRCCAAGPPPSRSAEDRASAESNRRFGFSRRSIFSRALHPALTHQRQQQQQRTAKRARRVMTHLADPRCCSAPGGIRTPGPQYRKLMLYPLSYGGEQVQPHQPSVLARPAMPRVSGA